MPAQRHNRLFAPAIPWYGFPHQAKCLMVSCQKPNKYAHAQSACIAHTYKGIPLFYL
nr:MAG TPA: hypothetical protein [Caudoviricetes sp.]